MSEGDKIGKAMARGLAIRGVASLLAVVAPILVIGWLCGTSLFAGIIHEDLAAPVFFVQLACLPFAGVAFGLGIGLLLRRTLLGPFRKALDPLGPRSRYLLSGVKWRVSVGGRTAEVRLARRTLSVVVPGKAGVELRGGRDNRLARLAMGEAWTVEELGGGVLVASKDPAALAAHLAQPGAREAWARLLADDGGSLRSAAVKREGGIILDLRHVPASALSTEGVRAWLEDMVVVLEAAEG